MPRFAVNLSVTADDFKYETSGTYEATDAGEAVGVILDSIPDTKPEDPQSFEFHVSARKLPE